MEITLLGFVRGKEQRSYWAPTDQSSAGATIPIGVGGVGGVQADRGKPRFVLQSRRQLYKYVLAFLDGVMVTVFVFSMPFRQILSFIDQGYANALFDYPENVFLPIFSTLTVLLFQANGLYKINVFLYVSRHAKQILKAIVYGYLLSGGFMIALYLMKLVPADHFCLIPILTSSIIMTITTRIVVWKRIYTFFTRNGLYSRSILIAGAGATGKRLAENLSMKKSIGFRVVGFLDDQLPVTSPVIRNLRVLGTISQLSEVAGTQRVNEVVICLENVPMDRLLTVIDHCRGAKALVTIASPAYGVVAERTLQECYGDVPVVGVNNFLTTSYAGAPVLKRIFDICFAIVAIVLLSPLMLLVAAAIKSESKGPVLFRQTRLGKKGHEFEFLKFRSMVDGSDNDPDREQQYNALISGKWKGSDAGTPTKIVNQAKVTKVGRFIRKTSLDELPQLFHVVSGDMSLVGPRPCLPYEWRHYEEWHRRRLDALPGCTGIWQVAGRSKVGFKEMVVLDIFYSQNISFHLDLFLILKTIPVMIFGRGGK